MQETLSSPRFDRSLIDTGMLNKGLPRGVECVLALSGLILILPILIVAAVAMKLTSKGPALFKQERIGFGGKGFMLFKIRTMSVASDGPLVTSAGDCRVTPVGSILRKTKIDEMPQLWNVVVGDMSFVGPRPEVPQLIDREDPLWQRVLDMKPGVTHPITLKLRHEELLLARVQDKATFYKEVLQPYKLNGYIRYLPNRNWKSDLGVILQTASFVLFPKTVPVPSHEELHLAYEKAA
jgi:lipopolysaccharide/colanic/teichoic acid biosynthesis glycosyltransferase